MATKGSVLALSVIATRCQLPQVGALGSPRKLHLFAKASPFGRGGCDQREQTERARMLTTEMTDSLLISLLMTRCTVGGVSYDKKNNASRATAGAEWTKV